MSDGNPCPRCPSAYQLDDLLYNTRHTINFSELEGLSKEDYTDRLKALTPIPTELKLAQLDDQIVAYEAQHGFSSEEMLTRVSSGDLEETEQICDWLLDLDLRGRLRNCR